jgi:putative phosphoribosyl transferase
MGNARWTTTHAGTASERLELGVDPVFHDRRDAGRQLGRALRDYERANPLVLGLPRGGVPVADEVAIALHAPLDVVIVRKLGSPMNPECGFGAVGEGGALVTDEGARREVGVGDEEYRRIIGRERAEIERRIALYRENRPMLDVTGRTVIVVDDGLATGSTASAAISVLRHLGAGRIVLAVPTGSAQAVELLRSRADEVLCLQTPEWFRAVGAQYEDFAQTTDHEVIEILCQHVRGAGPRDGTGAASGEGSSADISGANALGVNALGVDRDIAIEIRPGIALPGRITVPPNAIGVVAFAHGSGSSRLSPRNASVARTLQLAGLGTLLFDLLTDDEAETRANVFDIELLAQRLALATAWLRAQPTTGGLPIGYFGASTGAAAALVAASDDREIAAVVSRGGRPDLAGAALPRVTAPTLLIVGGLDLEVIALNRTARSQMTCPTRLDIVPGATHLFDEPGTLAAAAGLARDWFTAHLSRPRAAPGIRGSHM